MFTRVLKTVVCCGDLTVIDSRGRVCKMGGSPITGLAFDYSPRPVVIRITDGRTERRLAFRPRLAIGEAYMDGTLTIDAPATIYDLIVLLLYNLQRRECTIPFGMQLGWVCQRLFRWMDQYNSIRAAQRNVAHHYDLSGVLYDLFLDEDKQYSCAYFVSGQETLEEAQQAKKRHIASKLLLRPGGRVLDIGCGWGGMALYLARDHGVSVQGITLSVEQLATARDRAQAEGLQDRVSFEALDYRSLRGTYDRIVSVGMFEHVGVPHFLTFFRQVRSLLAEDGVALLHTIGRSSPPGGTNPWLRKYIFPGGYTPALSEIMRAVERSGLFVTDIEVLRTHYAETLRQWRERFLARWDEAKALYDERFCRMWEFYLAGCELVFRLQDQVVFQIQLTRNRNGVPETRDYIYGNGS